VCEDVLSGEGLHFASLVRVHSTHNFGIPSGFDIRKRWLVKGLEEQLNKVGAIFRCKRPAAVRELGNEVMHGTSPYAVNS
jgi:hypothetical protein